MSLDEMFRSLELHLMAQREKGARTIAPLDENETEEHVSMIAESSRIKKAEAQLQEDKELLDARNKIFWSKLRKRYHLEEIQHVRINEDRHLEEVLYEENNE